LPRDAKAASIARNAAGPRKPAHVKSAVPKFVKEFAGKRMGVVWGKGPKTKSKIPKGNHYSAALGGFIDKKLYETRPND